MVIYIFQSTGLGPGVDARRKSSMLKNVFISSRWKEEGVPPSSSWMWDLCLLDNFRESFHPDRPRKISFPPLSAYLLAWKYFPLPFEFPADFRFSLSLSLTVCSNESHLRSSRINGEVGLSLDDETCIYRDFQK